MPVLLNVAETGPYLHDGSIDKLEKVVEIMAWHQLDKKIDDKTIESIATFLGCLTGKLNSATK